MDYAWNDLKVQRQNIFLHGVIIAYLFTGALCLLLMYTYQYFAENSFKLVNCVEVKSLDSRFLYIDAHIECYRMWQVWRKTL